MSTTIRPATTADLPFLAWVMQEASTSHLERSVWATILGLPEDLVLQMLSAIATTPTMHWCHIERFRVVEVDGETAAACALYDPASEGNEALFAAAQGILLDAGASATDLESALRRAAVVDGATPKPFPAAWGIENVAVAPAHRGRSLAGLLLAAAAEDARSRGRDQVQVMCLEGNDRAQRAWERAGFTVRASYRGREFADLIGAPGMKLLVRDLVRDLPFSA